MSALAGTLGAGPGPLVVAEVAQAHDGSLGTAHAYVDAVARAGAGAVKFQTHLAHAESTRDEPWRQALLEGQRQNLARFSSARARQVLADAVDFLREGKQSPALVWRGPGAPSREAGR